jgi:colicin import membrane protein
VAGIVLYENTSPRWHPSQPSPKDSTQELLEEARRAAEEARLAEATAKKRQAEEEEAARRAAEAERIRLEREVEQRRRQAELQEARRRAEEQAMRAAEAERQRRAAEEKKAQAGLRNALIGKIIVAAACLLTVMCVLGAMSYVTISQVSAAHSRRVAATKMEVDRLTTLLQSTRSSLARHRDAIDRLARELYSAKQSQQGLPHAIAECKKRLRDATSSRVRHSRALADKVESLRGLPNAEFDVASKKLVAETERYRALTDNAEQELNEKRRAYSQALERVEAIPEEISDSQKQIALLEKEEATIEQELAQAKQSARNVFAKPTPAMPSR